MAEPSCYLIAGFTTAYNKAGKRLFERHLHAEHRSHAYTHDPLGRLTSYLRGKLAVAPEAPVPTEPPGVSEPLKLEGAIKGLQYNLDLLGNWDDPAYTPATDNAGAALQRPLSAEFMAAAQAVYDDLIRKHVHHRW